MLPRSGTIHCVGIGGSGMSALANVLLDRGYRITGSDREERASAHALRARGARLSFGAHRAESVPAELSCLVASEAIAFDNPELVAARERGVPILRYATALGLLMSESNGIALAGTHGKSTTTAFVATTLRLAGRDPSYVVGADVPALGVAGRGGLGSEFVAEACEYRRSFLELSYRIAGIVNVEAEHLDYFGDFAGVVAAFREFAARIRPNGTLVIGAAASQWIEAPRGVAKIVTAIGSGGDLVATRLADRGGFPSFAIDGVFKTDTIVLKVPGEHFVEDALVAAGVLHAIGLDPAAIAFGLSEYRGARRRLEVLRDDAVTVLTDYAHHPTEIAAVGAALRSRYPGRRLIGVFQPHQAARLRAFLDDFAKTLTTFDRVLVADVYRVRDSDDDFAAVDAAELARRIVKLGGSAIASGNAAATIASLGGEWRPGDVAVLLGAGDIDDQRDAVATALSVPDGR